MLINFPNQLKSTGGLVAACVIQFSLANSFVPSSAMMLSGTTHLLVTTFIINRNMPSTNPTINVHLPALVVALFQNTPSKNT